MSERAYSWLLRLYPKHFRESHGEEMCLLLRDRLREERGMAARTRLWMELCADLAASVPRERMRAWRIWRPQMVLAATIAAAALGTGLGLAGRAPAVPLVALQSVSILFGLRHCFRARWNVKWKEAAIRIEGDRIERVLPGSAAQTLFRSEVERLMEVGGFGLSVRAGERAGFFIPVSTPGYLQLREELARWRPIEVNPRPEFLRGGRRYRRWSLMWLFPVYVSAMLVQSATWSAALGALGAAWLISFWGAIETKRPAGSWTPRMILCGFVAPLVVHAGWVMLR